MTCFEALKASAQMELDQFLNGLEEKDLEAAVELIRPPAAAMIPSLTAFSTAETNCL